MIDSARPRNTLHSPSHHLAFSSSVPGSSRSGPYEVDPTHVTTAGSVSIYTDVVQKNLFGSPQLHQCTTNNRREVAATQTHKNQSKWKKRILFSSKWVYSGETVFYQRWNFWRWRELREGPPSWDEDKISKHPPYEASTTLKNKHKRGVIYKREVIIHKNPRMGRAATVH